MDSPTSPSSPDDVTRILAELSSARRLTKQEVLSSIPTADLGRMIDRIGKDWYVVLSKDGRSCLHDPVLRRPYTVKNKKFAEYVAAEVDGVVTTLAEGIRVLTERNKPND